MFASIVVSCQGVHGVRLTGQTKTELAYMLFESCGQLLRRMAASGHVFASGLDLGTKRGKIEVGKASLPEYDLTVNDDAINGTAVFRVDQLIGGIIQG